MHAYFSEHKVEAGLGRRSVRGGAVSTLARAVTAVVQVGSVLCLARLLTPEDYGLVAMVTAFTGFAPIFVDLGTRDAVVQRSRISEAEVSALFWLTLAIGCVCALAVAACGPLIAAFYGEPRLSGVVLVSSLTFVALALTAQHQALLRRAVKFRELAIVDVAASIISSGVAILMAYEGFGYWALVTRPLSLYSLSAAGTWIYCGWMPRKPSITSGVRQMVQFGLNLFGFSLTDFVARNSDRVAVGRGLGARTLGYYQNAVFIYDNLLDVLVTPLHQVASASLSKLQHDLTELRRSWARALSTLAFYTMPAFGVLAITGQDLIVVLLGQKWANAGLLLSVLALRGLPHSIERTVGWLHIAAGRTDRWLKWGIFAAAVQLVALLIGLPFGPYGIASAYVIAMYVLFVPAIAYSGRPLGIGARDVIGAVHAQLVSALVAAAAGFALRFVVLDHIPPLARMTILIVAYLGVYGVLVVGLFRVIAPLRVFLSLAKDVLPWRSASAMPEMKVLREG
jgi:PST family polysaccharide transporter